MTSIKQHTDEGDIMTTDQILIKNDGTGIERALEIPDSFAQKNGITGRDALHIRLLAEEMLGMVGAVAGEFSANFWIEGDSSECRLCLEAETAMNTEKRRELLSASSTGKNEAAKGVMGKIMELIEVGMENYEDVNKLQMMYGGSPLNYGSMGMESIEMSQAVLTWSLQRYRDSVSAEADEDRASEEAWDELEKSVVANLADDVRVGIKRDKVTITIYKKFR